MILNKEQFNIRKFLKIAGVIACIAAAAAAVGYVFRKDDIAKDFLTEEDDDESFEGDACCDDVENHP